MMMVLIFFITVQIQFWSLTFKQQQRTNVSSDVNWIPGREGKGFGMI
jgi:hypothetical protein